MQNVSKCLKFTKSGQMWPNVSKTVNNSKNVSFAKSALTYVLGKGTLSEMHFLVKTALFGKTTPPWTLWFPPPGTLWFHTTVDSLVSKPGQYWAIQANTGPYWPIQVNTGPYRPIQANTGPYWAILGHTGQYWAILGQIGPNRAKLCHFCPNRAKLCHFWPN